MCPQIIFILLFLIEGGLTCPPELSSCIKFVEIYQNPFVVILLKRMSNNLSHFIFKLWLYST